MSLAEQFLGLRLSRAGQPITPVEKAQALEAARAALSAFAPGAAVTVAATEPLGFAVSFFAALDRGLAPVTAARGQALLSPSSLALSAPGSAYACLTSGSTGEPKACVLTLDGAMANARAHARSLRLGAEHTVLQTLSLAHSFGVVAALLTPLVTGCALDFNDALLSRRALGRRTLSRVVLSLSPAQARWMLREGGAPIEGVEVLSVGAGLLTPEEWTALQAVFPGAACFATYGLTEAGPRVSTGRVSPGAPEGAGFIGVPLEGVDVAVLGDAREVAAAGTGRLLVRSPSLAHGLEPAQLHQGWLLTRDRVELKADGRLYFLGRESDVIKVGGLTFFSSQLEAAARKVEGVVDCAVVIRSHVLANDRWTLLFAGSASEDQVWAGLRSQLEPAALPVQVRCVPRVERSALGKVERAWAEVAAGAEGTTP
ncbi:MAG: fatty acid--CoA ligase family protein [Myxococcaceae bacterium]|nr:fatty acid--CoA ligase family protein [Myxococcaceae bacterium]